MSVIKEFKAFMMRGSVIDLAVGVIIGGAFGKIVTALVNDIIMPPIGMLTSGVNFTQMKYVLKVASVDATGKVIPPVTLNYGDFIQTLVDFIIVATIIFFVIKGVNTISNKNEVKQEPAAPPKEELLLTEIRDLLKEKR